MKENGNRILNLWINTVFAQTECSKNASTGFKILVSFAMLLCSLKAYTQQPMSQLGIEQAYDLARKNYPLIRQVELIKKTRDYTLENASKGYLPQVSFSGQATYQSAVTNFPFKIPIPGFTIPAYSKDQYKFYGQIDQVIYDGGNIRNQQQSAIANELIQQQNLETELYAVYDRVNQLYFGILLVTEQLKENKLVQQDIQNGIDKARALLANGTTYRSSVDELAAQLLLADQSRVEMEAMNTSYLNMLSVFINAPLDVHTQFDLPAAPEMNNDITRPELLLFDYQQKSFNVQEQSLHIQLRPKINLFLQGGYGRPGLNMLSNDFSWYYLAGLRFNWNIGSWYALKNQQALLGINRNNLEIQKETFLLNTRMAQQQQRAILGKFEELAKNDNAIILLRTAVKKAASAQLENGTLSAHDYIGQVNAEDQAKQNQLLHQIQYLQSRFSYQNISGRGKLK